MQVNRKSLAELCDPKLVRLAQVPIGLLTARIPDWLGANGNHHTIRNTPNRKQTRQTMKQNFTVRVNIYQSRRETPLKQGRPIRSERDHGRGNRPMEIGRNPQGPMTSTPPT